MTLAKFACSLLLVVSYGIVSAHAQDLTGFSGIDGAFVVYDMKNDRYVRYNSEKYTGKVTSTSLEVSFDRAVASDLLLVGYWETVLAVYHIRQR